MKKFKAGDRVRITLKIGVSGCSTVLIYNEKGTIERITSSGGAAVIFDNYNKYRHDLNGSCKMGHGFFLSLEHLEIIDRHERFQDILKELYGQD